MVDHKENTIDNVRALARSYFPECRFIDDDDSLETEDKDEIFYRKKDILPYLQTIFFEEHLVEIQAAQATRVFFANILDEDPSLLEDWEEGEVIDEDEEYEPGSYLKSADNFLLTPLTPAIGNAHIRNSKKVILRFFSGTIAIELGCTFREEAKLGEDPALRFNFPVVGRVNRNFRSFRAKVSPATDAKVGIRLSSSSEQKEILCNIHDVSVGGLAFVIPEDFPSLEVGQGLSLNIMVQGINHLKVGGTVRNVNKVRDKKGYMMTCGIQFDLESRALAADLEKLTASVQRMYLREIAEKTDDLEGVRIIR